MRRTLRSSTCFSLWLLFLASLFALACGEEAAPPTDDNVVVEGEIQPEFEIGQTWIVGTIYRQASIHLPEDVVALDVNEVLGELTEQFVPHIPAEILPPETELWSEVIYWQVGVINTDYIPEEDSSFYDLCLDPAGNAQPITIIKAVAPKELNDPAISDELDPVFYLVLRQSDFRVRGIHYNYRVGDGRNTVVLELPENESGSPAPGADMSYFLVDYLLPILPLDPSDYVMIYGNQSDRERMTVTGLSDEAAEVIFFNAMDGQQVRQRWDAGQPWFSYSVTDSRISWLASDVEIAELMEARGVEYLTNEAFLESPEAIARKFRNRINLSAELRVQAGSFSRTAPPEFYPWAGNYWPTKEGALVMGYGSSTTPSRLALTQAPRGGGDTLQTRLSNLDRESDALRALRRQGNNSDDEYNRRVNAYWEGREQVVTSLRDYYENSQTGFITRLRNGQVDLSDVNNWAPLDKFGLLLLSRGQKWPFEAAIWEAGTQFHPGGPGWWGKCNGWSAAAILYSEPRQAVTIDVPLSSINGQSGTLSLHFTSADLKGLLSASNYSGYSLFYGERYDSEENDPKDLYPDVFHRLITYYIGTEHFPVVFDTTAKEEVWNFPAYAYEMTITEGDQDSSRNCRIMHVTTDLSFSTDGVGYTHVDSSTGVPRGFTEHYTYDLCVRTNGSVVYGEWTGSSVEDHPDFCWVAYQNDPRNSTSVHNWSTSQRGNQYFSYNSPSENPFLYTNVLHELVQQRVNAPVVCNPDPDDCPSGSHCNVETGQCVSGGSTPQPGQTCAGGQRREDAVVVSASPLNSQQVCSGRDSWFAFDLTANQTLHVTVSFTHASGDIDIALYNPSGSVVAQSDSTADQETVSHRATTAGRYALRVYGYNNAQNTVNLTYEITSSGGSTPSGCRDSASEPNDSIESATRLTNYVSGFAGAVCDRNDVDYYRVEVGGTFRATINFSHSQGDLDLALYDTDGNQTAISQGTSDTETVTGTGTAILKVYGWDGATGDYTLTLSSN